MVNPGSTGSMTKTAPESFATNSFGVNIANGQTAPVHMRYNITAVEGISRLCPASLSVIRNKIPEFGSYGK